MKVIWGWEPLTLLDILLFFGKGIRFWRLDLFFVEWSPDTVADNFGVTIHFCSEMFQYMTKATTTVHMLGNDLFVHF